jgi:uncharacterized protein
MKCWEKPGKKAETEAIRVFAANLRQLLLAKPLGPANILAIDPGFRSGCKLVCLDRQGNLLHNETIYPHPPQKESSLAIRKIESLVDAYRIEAIAIGDGTAGRETDDLIRRIRFRNAPRVFVVSEDGASVYSASPVAREEFPEYDVTVRGAISIGRRLLDPLAELVKIEPKSLGVGQYQHDVDQGQLRDSLNQEVELCVNTVGVNLNTASKHLLSFVSGVGPGLAAAIARYRQENGSFRERRDLMRVPRLGPRAFEQAAGFLRIPDSPNPLDNTAVHPESYPIVAQMAKKAGCSLAELVDHPERRKALHPEEFVAGEAGLPTILDILDELNRPGRDPRQDAAILEFAPDVFSIADLKPGMVVAGLVSNITNFGAFVDIGVKQDGLVHVSQMADRYISNPLEVVKLHQHIRVKVLEVDLERKRIQLSMKLAPGD